MLSLGKTILLSTCLAALFVAHWQAGNWARKRPPEAHAAAATAAKPAVELPPPSPPQEAVIARTSPATTAGMPSVVDESDRVVEAHRRRDQSLDRAYGLLVESEQ